MKIYYVKYRGDQDYETVLADCQFFATEEKANEVCAELEAKRKAAWQRCYQGNFEKWKKTEVAYKILEASGCDAKEVFPYHKREWKAEAYPLEYSVDSVEVEE